MCCCACRHSPEQRERLFCVIAYLPKATVQAAIGSVPLAAGLLRGLVLSVAVLASSGDGAFRALGMDAGAPRLLAVSQNPRKFSRAISSRSRSVIPSRSSQ